MTSFKLFLLCLFLIFSFFFAVFLLYLFDEAGSCAEEGNVWDSQQKICRKDCLAWHKDFGCIPLEANDCAEQKGIWSLEDKKCLYSCNSWKKEQDCSSGNKPFLCPEHTQKWDKNWKNCRKTCGNRTKKIFCPNLWQ